MFTHAYTHAQRDQSDTVYIPSRRHVCFQIKSTTTVPGSYRKSLLYNMNGSGLAELLWHLQHIVYSWDRSSDVLHIGSSSNSSAVMWREVSRVCFRLCYRTILCQARIIFSSLLVIFFTGHFNANPSWDQSLLINQDHADKSLRGAKEILYLKHYYL